LIVEPGVVRVQGLRAVIPRPGINTAGAPSRPRSLTEPFAAEPGIHISLMSGGIVRREEGIELGLSDVELVGVPLEPWVLEIFGLTRAQRQDLGVLPIAGMMNVRFTTAKLGANRLILNGGRADLSGIHLGSSADFYLERGVLKDVSVSADREGNLRFGGPDTVFEGTNFQLFGVPVPKIEARLHGDRFGAELSRIRGVLFGYEFPAQQGQGVDPRPAGVIWEEETRLAVTWDGDFSFDAHLRDVEIASAVRALGGAPQGVRGRLSARLAIGGHVGDVGSWQGSGWVSADAINVVHLPLFLNILKAIDPTTWSLNRSPRTRIRFEFDVGDSVVRLREGGSLSSDNLRLALMPGGTVTFGGIINARLDASHRSGSIPVVSDLLSALPSILLDGVVVQGPLEDPVVEPRSFGIGGDTGTSGSGRRPRMKPLKNENDR
jgi:hypothetical protein